MTNIGLKIMGSALLLSVVALNASAASISDSLALSAAATVAAGNTLTVTETLAAQTSGPIQEIDSVIGFDPTVFSISNFSTGSPFSTWSTTANSSPSSGIWDYDVFGSSVSLSGSPGNAVDYTVLTFTLTALQNANLGNSNVLILGNNGASISTAVKNDSSPLTLSPAPSSSFNSNIDVTIDVTSPSTPEPATFLLMGLPLAGIALLRRRAKQ